MRIDLHDVWPYPWFHYHVGMQVIFPVASHSGVQEEYHSKVQDPQLQRPDFGIEKYGTKVPEDHNDQQSAADKRSGQIRFRHEVTEVLLS